MHSTIQKSSVRREKGVNVALKSNDSYTQGVAFIWSRESVNKTGEAIPFNLICERNSLWKH